MVACLQDCNSHAGERPEGLSSVERHGCLLAGLQQCLHLRETRRSNSRKTWLPACRIATKITPTVCIPNTFVERHGCLLAGLQRHQVRRGQVEYHGSKDMV